MTRSVLNDRSPYAFECHDPRLPGTRGLWSWRSVLQFLVAFEDSYAAQPQLPPQVQRRGAAGALAVSLAVAQLGILAETGWPP